MSPHIDDDDITVLTSNVSYPQQHACQAHAHVVPLDVAGGMVKLPPQLSIADSGATQIFVMEGSPIVNRRPLDVRPSSTRPRKSAARGQVTVPTHGASARHWTTSAAIITLSLKLMHIGFPARQSSSLNTAKSFFCFGMKTY